MEQEKADLEDDLKLKAVALKDESARLVELQKSFKNLKEKKDNEDHVLTLLSLLQENGRLLDFLMDDITSYSDEQVGAASRVVHQGCVKVLKDYFAIVPVASEEEGSEITLSAAHKNAAYRMVGEGELSELSAGRLLHKV